MIFLFCIDSHFDLSLAIRLMHENDKKLCVADKLALFDALNRAVYVFKQADTRLHLTLIFVIEPLVALLQCLETSFLCR